MEDKLAVYICTGYGIGEALDIDALVKVARDELKANVVKTVASCESEDLAIIKKEVAEEGVNRLVIAGPTFRFYPKNLFPGVMVDYANLREQVVWSQEPNHEDTQMMAEDYIRMAVTKVRKMALVEPFPDRENLNRDIMVVGGGISGLTAAYEAAETGYKVYLIEKEAELGGWYKKLYKTIPHTPPYEKLEDTHIEDLIDRVKNHKNITVITGAKLEKIVGAPCLFDVHIEGVEPFRVGAIIQATGWKPADPDDLGHLGYKKFANVVSSVRMEEMAKAGKIVKPSDGNAPASVLFVQNEGSPEEGTFSYSSSINSLNALKQALYIREANLDAKAFVVYDHFRAPGNNELFYKSAQQDPGVFMTKGRVVSVEDGGDKLKVHVDNTLLGENIELDVDMVVVGVGMVPNSADSEKIRLYNDAQAVIKKGEAGAQLDDAKKKSEDLKEHAGTEILNLVYRQGPDLPVLKWGYPDSHFICFPYETRRTGIYASGAVRSPMDGQGAQEDALGAALKAIQCVEMTSRGEALHPRAGDQSYPEFFLQRCTQCKRCTEECPFGVLNEDVKGTPLPNPTRCRRCGVCMGACPERIISFKDYSVDMIANVIKAVEVPDEYEEKPRVLILACENDAYPALDMAGINKIKYSPFVRVIPVRCLGSVNIVWINEALSKGYDGILLFGCKWGDDYQCHFVKGSEMMKARSANVREKLQQMALEDERVGLFEVEITDYERLPKIINEFVENIVAIGMNPFKGM